MGIHQQALQAALADQAPALALRVFDEIHSTNQWLAQHPPASPMLVVAEHQTAGRGRRGRHWHSPCGGLYFSIGQPLAATGPVPSVLPLAVAIAIAQQLQAFGIADVRVKWPNDIVVNGAKLAGILVEKTAKTLIVGIGINLETPVAAGLPDDRKAIGLNDLVAGGHAVPPEAMLASLATAVWEVLDMQASAMSDWLQKNWQQWDALAGSLIEVEQSDGSIIQGTAQGVTTDGALRLETPQGEQALHSGETRIRGGWEKLG